MSQPVFFTVITPTLERPSLIVMCKSLEAQTFDSWEHLVANDVVPPNVQWYNRLAHPQRRLLCCAEHHGNYGNTCRHNAWELATGEWILYVDDDNFFHRDDALSDLATALEAAGRPDWAVIPMMRHGHVFFHTPPGLCMSDTANIVVKREIGRWPAGSEYTMDGLFIEQLKISHPNYAVLGDLKPIINMPSSSEGR